MGHKPWHNLTRPYEEPEWTSKSEFKLPHWAEPMMIVVILFTTMFLTRRRGYSILGRDWKSYRSILDASVYGSKSTDELLAYDIGDEDERQSLFTQEKKLPKTRYLCGLAKIYTPNSSRFKNYFHSRIMQKLPFLVEMFYWLITYAAYHYSQVISSYFYLGKGIWNAAEAHALSIVEFERYGWINRIVPSNERTIQQWFMNGHQDALTFLNRSYSLIHIPGTIGFIGWYYYSAPSHPTFAIVRRTLTLTNYLAFTCFCFYPVTPPRLLPKEYGFLDTVHHDDAQSVWMSGKYVNQLAAMPSMHFGYAFCIGCVLIWHSGVFRRRFEKNEVRKNVYWKTFYCFIGVLYPSYILLTILATANHYWLDAFVAFFVVIIAFLCNRLFLVLMPLEDLLLWVLRLEKPIPTTGERSHSRGGRL